jgi:hypothetical protein
LDGELAAETAVCAGDQGNSSRNVHAGTLKVDTGDKSKET